METKLKVGRAKISITPLLDQARRLGPKGLATDIIGELCARATVSESPYDDALRVVIFEDMDGRPLCGLANFGCHNDLAFCGTTLNSDFFGWVMPNLWH